MERELFCPLATPYQAIEGQRGTLICLREGCAWWIHGEEGTTDNQRCAIPVLAVRLGALDSIADNTR